MTAETELTSAASASVVGGERRHDFELIASWVRRDARVLDLGCGDGSLLEHLRLTRGARGVGVDVDGEGVVACLRRGGFGGAGGHCARAGDF